MKSRFFTDTQGLDAPTEPNAPNMLCVCLRLSRGAYEQAVRRAAQSGLSSGEYIQRLLERELERRED